VSTMSSSDPAQPVPSPEPRLDRVEVPVDPYEVHREAIYSAFPGVPRDQVDELLGVFQNGPEPEIKAVDIAVQAARDSNQFELREKGKNYELARRQAQGWYRASLTAASIGFLLFGVGMVLAIAGAVKPGLISMASGVIQEVVATLFTRQSKAADERVENIQKSIDQQHQFRVAVELAETMWDPKARDEIKKAIIFGLFHREAIFYPRSPNNSL
jgi:hypothetical protein